MRGLSALYLPEVACNPARGRRNPASGRAKIRAQVFPPHVRTHRADELSRERRRGPSCRPGVYLPLTSSSNSSTFPRSVLPRGAQDPSLIQRVITCSSSGDLRARCPPSCHVVVGSDTRKLSAIIAATTSAMYGRPHREDPGDGRSITTIVHLIWADEDTSRKFFMFVRAGGLRVHRQHYNRRAR